MQQEMALGFRDMRLLGSNHVCGWGLTLLGRPGWQVEPCCHKPAGVSLGGEHLS